MAGASSLSKEAQPSFTGSSGVACMLAFGIVSSYFPLGVQNVFGSIRFENQRVQTKNLNVEDDIIM
jgi:hypothetical protein